MDLQFHGANCITISSKKARLVIDDNLAELGAKSVTKEGDIVLFTGTHGEPAGAKLLIDQPGEYEASGASIYGIAAQGNLDTDDQKTKTIYKVAIENLNILIVGHILPELSDAQLEAIGMVDVMFVPIGGYGFTMDGVGALKLVKKIEPKLIIPTYYEDASLKFEVPALSLEEGLKALAMEPKETVQRLRLKPGDLGESTQLIVLERS